MEIIPHNENSETIDTFAQKMRLVADILNSAATLNFRSVQKHIILIFVLGIIPN